jgi:maltose O-acetyltransferase
MRVKSLALAVRRVWAGDPAIPPGTSIGKDVFIGPGVTLDWAFGHLITIGDETTIVSGSRILCHDAASNRRLGVTWCAPVAVGRRVYVGADALIMPGVTIGDDAVVAAGAVVTKDVAAGAIVAGVPATTISSTVELDERRRALLQTRRVFGPEFMGSHLSAQRIEVLRAAAREGGYFLRSASRSSAPGDLSQATVGPKTGS